MKVGTDKIGTARGLLPDAPAAPARNNGMSQSELDIYLSGFSLASAKRTLIEPIVVDGVVIKRYTNEFWTAKQRQASSLHEVSYRACFKPQLPRFFIQALTEENDTVYDPFSGRGTTAIEAALCNRSVIANDINPLSAMLSRPRLMPPSMKEIRERLERIPFEHSRKADIDLSMFYHPDTEGELVSLRDYLAEKARSRSEDAVDRWLRMVATNRLTGHSSGFFSVYSLPPNQAASPESQRRINEKLGQHPDYRDVRKIILKKSKQLLSGLSAEEKMNLERAAQTAQFICEDARSTSAIPSRSVQLTVTSPPFLDIVQYSADNWLRCWFNCVDIDAVSKRITMSRTVEEWSSVMGGVFQELFRVTRPGGWVAFEVGEIRKGTVRLDEVIIPLGLAAGFTCFGVLINSQIFTKTSNIWGVGNNKGGTNTNRVVIFHKGEEREQHS